MAFFPGSFNNAWLGSLRTSRTSYLHLAYGVLRTDSGTANTNRGGKKNLTLLRTTECSTTANPTLLILVIASREKVTVVARSTERKNRMFLNFWTSFGQATTGNFLALIIPLTTTNNNNDDNIRSESAS